MDPKIFKKSLFELDLSSHTTNALKKAGLTTVGLIVQRDDDSLLRIKNFGKGSLRELKEEFQRIGAIEAI